MHNDFPKLFAEISTDGSKRSLRWKGIETFTANLPKAKIEVLSRLAFATKPPAAGLQQEHLASALTAFHNAFSEADPSIEAGQRQDQILAAGALLRCFTTNSLAAMAATTTACGGARKFKLPIDLIAAAESGISRFAALRRQRPDLSKIKTEAPKLTFELDFDAVAFNQPKTYQSVFAQFAEAIDEAFVALASKFEDATETIIASHNKADEELDMLSWVFGGRTLQSSQQFADVPVIERPLVFAHDLASLTTIKPGPNSMPALLSRAGIKASGKLTIVDAVNAVSDDWTFAALKGVTPSSATSPIHFALVKRQETGSGEGWQAGWAAITGIDVATAMSPIMVGELFYREILWLR